MDAWAGNANEKFVVDYDLTSGLELGIIHVRQGNTNRTGTVTYIPWPTGA